jgi:hypothetical protein
MRELWFWVVLSPAGGNRVGTIYLGSGGQGVTLGFGNSGLVEGNCWTIRFGEFEGRFGWRVNCGGFGLRFWRGSGYRWWS